MKELAKKEQQPLSLEEVARRMLAMPVKTRDEMTAKKAKPNKKNPK